MTTKTNWKQAYRNQRISERRETAPAYRIAKRLVANLTARVRAEVAPQIAALRELDEFIASGKSSLTRFSKVAVGE